MSILEKIFAFLLKCVGLGGRTIAEAKESAPKEQLKAGETAELTPTSAEDSKIAFHPKLVPNLKADHQNLLGLFTGVLEDAKNHKFEGIPEQLEKFKAELAAHLQLENTKFYGYLEQSLSQSTQEFRDMRAFRREMRNIERAVLKYLDAWIDEGVNGENLVRFQEESDGIAGALVKRIQSEEEKLYPIYADQSKEATA